MYISQDRKPPQKKDELKEIQTNLLHQQEQQQEMKCYTGVLLFVIGLLQVSKF